MDEPGRAWRRRLVSHPGTPTLLSRECSQYGPYFNNTAVWVPVNGSTAPAGFAVNFTTARHVVVSTGNVTVALGVPLLPTNPDASYWFVGGPSAWMATLVTCTAAYAGVEVLPLLAKLLREPKKSIPVRLSRTSVWTLPLHDPLLCPCRWVATPVWRRSLRRTWPRPSSPPRCRRGCSRRPA